MTRERIRLAMRKALEELAEEQRNPTPRPAPRPFRGGRHPSAPSKRAVLESHVSQLIGEARRLGWAFGEEIYRMAYPKEGS